MMDGKVQLNNGALLTVEEVATLLQVPLAGCMNGHGDED